MKKSEELLEKFGKQVIEEVRDNQIHYVGAFLDRTSYEGKLYEDDLANLSQSQTEMIRQMAISWVDGTLHDLFYLLEDSDWVTLQLKDADGVAKDVRKIAYADLQGYISMWAEKYSKQNKKD